MSAQLKTLLDKRAQAWEAAKGFGDRSKNGEELSAEDRKAWDAALDEVETLSSQIDTEERSARVSAAMEAATGSDTPTPAAGEDRSAEREYREAFLAYLRGGNAGLDGDQRAALARGQVDDQEIRALAGGTGSSGGYTIPTELLNKMTEALKAFGGLLGVANVISSTDGHPINWPTNDDTANVGAILADNTQITEQDTAFGTKALGAYTYTSKLMRVPWNLLNDSAFDLESFLGRKAGERIGRAVSAHLVSGTGSSQPAGLFNGATSAFTSATGTAITADELLDLQHSIDPAYRAAGNCRYVLNDATLKGLRKLKDSDGQYLWQPSVKEGVPSTLFGYPYLIDQGVADVALSSKSVGFGDVAAAFVVRQVAGGSMVTLRERYADYLQNGYFAFQRFDSVIDNSAAFKVITQKAS